jgi:enoyl-CoA hydratase/carnithine racemase
VVTSSTLRSEVSAGILTLTLDRPQARNAINAELRDALSQALDGAAMNPDVRAVVLGGAGGAFCSGGDVGDFGQLHDPRAYHWVSQRLSSMISGLEQIEKPTIAVIDGVATGAGLALALAADWRIGTPRTRMLYREGLLGMLPTHGGCARLVKLIGLARAREAVLGGDELDATDAYRVGMLSEVAEGDGLKAARDRATKMLRRSPLSYGAVKRVLQIAADADVRTGMLAESLAQGALLGTADHREGLAAARERREPSFTASVPFTHDS